MRGGLAVAAAMIVLVMASSARAHEDPSGCFETGPAIIVSVFRADEVTGVVGNVSECETIKYRATLQKANDLDSICAFSGGTFRLTTPDGVVHDIDLDVPCIGGNTGLEGCDEVTNSVQSALIPYTVSPGDVVGGLITATSTYTGGVAHDSPLNTAGVAATTPKSTPVVFCNDNDLCTNDVCDPALQGSAACSNPPVVCIDENLCTADSCDPATGQCVFTPNVVCDDGSLCTDDACNPATGQCVFTPNIVCDDGNLCTLDTCNPATGQCVFTPNVPCDDQNACTDDACNPATGQCVFTPNITCNDNDACTDDTCNPATGQCVFTPNVVCNDDNLCTLDTCNPATGQCVFTPNVPCDDQNACTDDACNPATGQCVFTPNITCDDQNACTADSCNPATGQCVFTPNVPCDDQNLCTADSCNPATGQCVFTPNVPCDDNNVCTSDVCNPATGQCVFTPTLDCNDHNVCTTDTCDPVLGCQHTPPLTCDDDDPCTDDSCDPNLGCQNVRNDNPVCNGLDHFQCYEIKPFAFARRSVTVEDRYVVATVGIRSPNRLCAPSDKRGEDPTAPANPEHLTGYPSLSTPVRVQNQRVANQFGTLKLDLIRRKFLFVPTAKSLVQQPGPLVGPVTDHFQCYQVRRSAGEPRFQAIRGVSAVDQFGSHAMDLLRPRYLCVPANKANENPGAPNHLENLLCYKARHRVRFPTLKPFINNQFSAENVTITRRMEFCVPTTFVTD